METDGATLDDIGGSALAHPLILTGADSEGSRPIGRGRSGTVYLDQQRGGRQIARKVFSGDGLGSFIVFLATGAPNPYHWNRHAVRAALYRRQILSRLVAYWFDGKLQVPETFGTEWNPRQEAFELRAEYIAGVHLPLRWCAESSEPDPIDELTGDIMRPLQTHLIEAGFDGLVWQAGLGNPVAGGNFMLQSDRKGQRTWYWIDLESGVPAIVPLNPLSLFRFYLPRALKYRRLLFDDVDIRKLRRYLEAHGEQIERKLGEGVAAETGADVDKLDDAQGKWKSLDRTATSIEYFQRRGLLSSQEADWYRHHPWLWLFQSWGLGAKCVLLRLVALLPALIRRCLSLDYEKWLRRLKTFYASSRYRRRVANLLTLRRMDAWRQRQFISSADIDQLRSELRRDQANQCVTDFCVHVSIKPAVKTLQWCLLPMLFMIGLLPLPMLVFLEVFGGSLARTAYTTHRCLGSSHRSGPRPWVALAVGLFPFVGNLAFPLQFVYWCRDRQSRIAQFLLYDCLASLGRAVFIWGGENSLVEAWANRLPQLWLRRSADRAYSSPSRLRESRTR